MIDHQKFSEYALTHHSTSIEGSTLTELDTRLLLDEGITPKGKPLVHSLMVRGHYEALQFTLKNAQSKNPVMVELILTEAQMMTLERKKEKREALGEIETEHPAYLGSQDTYHVDTIIQVVVSWTRYRIDS